MADADETESGWDRPIVDGFGVASSSGGQRRDGPFETRLHHRREPCPGVATEIVPAIDEGKSRVTSVSCRLGLALGRLEGLSRGDCFGFCLGEFPNRRLEGRLGVRIDTVSFPLGRNFATQPSHALSTALEIRQCLGDPRSRVTEIRNSRRDVLDSPVQSLDIVSLWCL